MSNIDIANSFFGYYASAATATTEDGRTAAYQGMQQCLDENVTFSDMAYNEGITGKKVFAMWHWFCTKQPAPVRVTFAPSKTREQGGVVIVVYRAEYVFGYDPNDSSKGKPIDYTVTAILTITNGKITDHKDFADIEVWATQAMGAGVAAISSTPAFKDKLRGMAEQSLDAFIEKVDPLYK
jgi:ketosteroid isomerase-like protein